MIINLYNHVFLMFEIFNDPDVDQINEADFKLSGFEFGNNFFGFFSTKVFFTKHNQRST